MDTEKKLKKYNNEEKQKLIDDFLKDQQVLELKFANNQKPIPYARARAGRNGFYNPKAKEETEFKKICLNQISLEDWKILSDLIKNENALYYVSITGDFYVPIPTSDSAKITTLKEAKIILPSIRNGDIDNYMKFVLDSLHDVIYDDDKRVIEIKANKYYSINPRTELSVKIRIIQK